MNPSMQGLYLVSVLDLVMLYINNINNNSSPLRLFTDDCIIYRTIKSEQDHLPLQQDLHTVYEWSQKWQMHFNISKCITLRCYRMLSPSLYNYLHMSSTISLYLVLTNISILVLL